MTAWETKTNSFYAKDQNVFPLEPADTFASYSANAGLDNKGILSLIL